MDLEQFNLSEKEKQEQRGVIAIAGLLAILRISFAAFGAALNIPSRSRAKTLVFPFGIP